MKNVIKNMSLLAAAFIVIFLTGEIILNVADFFSRRDIRKTDSPKGQLNRRGLMRDSRMNRSHIPSLKFIYEAPDKKEFKVPVQYSSKGLNDEEYAYPKPEGTGRIIILGDSFTEAIQVERGSNFCEILENELNDTRAPEKTEVINMGVSGYSPILEYLYLKNEGLKYDPDMVILCFFMNDVYEDSVYKGMAEFDENGLPIRVHWKGKDKISALTGWKRTERKACNAVKRVLNKSKFYVFLKEKIYIALKKSGLKEKKSGRKQFFIIEGSEDAEERRLWQDTFRYVLAIRNLAESHGAKFLFVAIPMEAQLSDDPDDAAFNAYFTGTPDSGRTNAAIKEFCVKNNIEYINLFDYFAGRGAGDLYFKHDGHFRPAGHRLTAEIIKERIGRGINHG